MSWIINDELTLRIGTNKILLDDILMPKSTVWTEPQQKRVERNFHFSEDTRSVRVIVGLLDFENTFILKSRMSLIIELI
mgnify:CR=1 FL=1